MINFQEELKKYKPQTTLEEIEDNLQEDALQDLADLFHDLIKKLNNVN